MRQLLFIFLIIFLVACGSSNTPDEFKKQPPDTTLTTIQYAHNWAFNDYRTVTAEKIVLDTLEFASVDSLTQKKRWIRDTVYVIQLMDTVRNGNVIVRDSLGKPKLEMKLFIVPKNFVLHDYNRKWGK